ncbi:hypothetical protein LCGC14_2029300 [marine sediment metagenome]|uniref:Uncharacterized protein n=1 Tax=marine sediment metagenome TaxID=412755 RepID=A0A0F9FHP2_9ZZZZ
MQNQKDERITIRWLAHHNPNRDDFDDHVFYFFNYAICIGCFSFVLGVTIGLIIGNIFYEIIANVISLPIILFFFIICWIPLIFQYSIQIIRKKPQKNRTAKFFIRFLYPVGSIIFTFKSPLWGLGLSIIAGYLILYIRNLKNRTLKQVN